MPERGLPVFESRTQAEGGYVVTACCIEDLAGNWTGSFRIERMMEGSERKLLPVQGNTVMGDCFRHSQDALRCALEFGLRRARDGVV